MTTTSQAPAGTVPSVPPVGALYAAYSAAALVWGASFFFIEIGLRGLSPLQVALARLLLGSAALLAYLALRRRALLGGLRGGLRTWGHLSVLGLLFCALPYALFSWAQTSLTSGLASVYNATTPLWTLLGVLAFVPAERVTRWRVAGIALGFAGVCLVFAPALASPEAAPVAAHLACLAATACYGLGFVWVRRFVMPLGLPTPVIATGQVVTGAVWAALFVAVAGRQPVELSWQVVAAMAGLGVLGTGMAYLWITSVTAGLGATVASTVTYLTPVVGVVLGALALGEDVAWYEIAGGAVIVAGVAVGQGVLRVGSRSGRRV